MRVEKVRLIDFRGFDGTQDIEIPPRLCVLVGVNGAGKTAVLEATASLLSGCLSWISGARRFWFGANDEGNINSGANGARWGLWIDWGPDREQTAGVATGAGPVPQTSAEKRVGYLDELRAAGGDPSVPLPFVSFLHSGSTRPPWPRPLPISSSRAASRRTPGPSTRSRSSSTPWRRGSSVRRTWRTNRRS